MAESTSSRFGTGVLMLTRHGFYVHQLGQGTGQGGRGSGASGASGGRAGSGRGGGRGGGSKSLIFNARFIPASWLLHQRTPSLPPRYH